MKHNGIGAICLILMASLGLPVFGDETTVNLESRVIEDFSGSSGLTWKATASKFAHTETDDEGNVTDEYPKLATVEAWPTAIYKKAALANQEETPKSLGINGSFDRRGYNWIDVYATQTNDNGEEARYEIPLPGRTQYLDMWVWGSNLNYYIEAYIRDYQGVVHNLRFGNIGYTGWRNIRTNIPNHIPQYKRILPRLESLKFIKFRIWTQPVERVNDFYIYFNQFKILTDTFESLYDGDELADPEYVQQLWDNSGDGSAN
ncbi:MAG: flagellar filament outer layer protein FlaA [Treponema sp.]|jgi:hypothetical protein|nr:flagellar filament outer layer protein FlaA [Treponema sp.]